jgi:hypothetical protein
VHRRLLELDGLLVRSLGPVEIERAAELVDLVEMVVADEPPDLGDVARLCALVRLLRDRDAVVRVGVLERRLLLERGGRRTAPPPPLPFGTG